MRRLLTIGLLLMCGSLMADAQTFQYSGTKSLTATNASCTATACVAMPVAPDVGTVVIQLAGTFVGTVSFEGSVDGTHMVAVAARPIAGGATVTSATAGGIWVVNAAGLRGVQARVSAYTSGTVSASMARSAAMPAIYNVTLPGALEGTSVASSGGISGTTGTFSGAVSTGALTPDSVASAGAVSGTTGTFTGNLSHAPGNGSSVAFKSVSELLTVAASATTDTALDLPANAIILGVSVRVTTAIPTAATFTVIGASSSTAFQTGTSVLVAANTTDAGTKSCPYLNATAQKVRITPNLTPGANTGRVRVTVYYIEVTAPSS